MGRTPRFAHHFASFIPNPFFLIINNSINMPPRKRTAIRAIARASNDTIEVDAQPARFQESTPDPFSNQLETWTQSQSQFQPPFQPLEGSTDSIPENEEGAKLSWSYQMEEVLFDALLEQNRLGKRADAGFKSEAWTAALAAVQAEYNLGSNKKKLTVAQLNVELRRRALRMA
jgi:hypothetical protein